MVRMNRATDMVAEAYLESAHRCRQKAIDVLTDDRLSPEERIDASEGLKRMAVEQEERARRWRAGLSDESPAP
jgi:hypothetical protein